MVAIKNIKMPSCCAKCDFKEDYCFYCTKLHKDIPQSNFSDSRLSDCPLTEIVTCENCNNHGINKEYPDIDGARYCSKLHTYTGYDFFCGDGERKGVLNNEV